jgi:hypothetical protein
MRLEEVQKGHASGEVEFQSCVNEMSVHKSLLLKFWFVELFWKVNGWLF